jgi:hypothetical protein
MNPYPQRIEELHQCLESRYGQRDRQATEILLIAMLDPAITRTRRPWIMIETDWPRREFHDAWFAFGAVGDAIIPKSLALARIARAQAGEAIMQEWLAGRRAGTPGIFVEAEWRRLPRSGGSHGGNLWRITHSYAVLLAQCVRLRVAHPRSNIATRFDTDADGAELCRLTRRVLDNEFRRTAAPKADPLPPSFLYWCELLQKVAPCQTDWESLTGGLASAARGIATLYCDGRSADWRAAERIMRDTIGYETSVILSQAGMGRSEGRKAFEVFCRQHDSTYDTTVEEIRRLNREGVILARKNYGLRDGYRYHPWRYLLGAPEWRELIDRGKEILK